MKSIVFSFVGEQDPYSLKTEEEGSIISLLRHLLQAGKQIHKVVLLHTEGTRKGAKDTKDWIESEPDLSSVETEILLVSESLSDDPIDLLLAAQEVRKRLENLLDTDSHIEFNASSGTPAMKSAFSILQAAGYVENGTVWQVRNPKQMKPNQQRVFVTDVGILRREFELKVLTAQVENFDFDSSYDLFSASDIAGCFPKKDLIASYLKAGKAWQRSKLDDFKNCIEDYLSQEQKTHSTEWYYPAYEEAYLSIVRCRQGNIVEAFFHSFRAFEGILAFWSKQKFGCHIVEKDGAVFLCSSILEDREKFFATAKYKTNGDPSDDLAKLECRIKKFFEEQSQKSEPKNFLLEFSSLSKFFRSFKPEYKQKCPTIKNLLSDEVSSKRNVIVHQLQGLQEQNLYQNWGVENYDDWQRRILEYLNFIANQSFCSWGEASLMEFTHQSILSAISEYRP